MLSSKVLIRRNFVLINARFNSTLVIAEHDESKLSPITLNAVTGTNKFRHNFFLLIEGGSASKVAEEASKISNVKRIFVAQDPALKKPANEYVSENVIAAHDQFKYSHILASAFGRRSISRVAAKHDFSPISEITVIHIDDTVSCPIYAGNAIAKAKSNVPLNVFTIRSTAFEQASPSGGSVASNKELTEKGGPAVGVSRVLKNLKGKRNFLTSNRYKSTNTGNPIDFNLFFQHLDKKDDQIRELYKENANKLLEIDRLTSDLKIANNELMLIKQKLSPRGAIEYFESYNIPVNKKSLSRSEKWKFLYENNVKGLQTLMLQQFPELLDMDLEEQKDFIARLCEEVYSNG